ncbi:hypothetical protein CB0940_06769 [Cercospora beticola]|uniref:Uncharacterized protein n=1 Tax=Cercospora beticola TaxID=122368 RepID=A0A2G5H7H0_CERBT|nr:hypothetical protein CB0940_06769 [Cercospora beticola]PIA88471.1 hypothetical protein CB0940_06769 [Cercospora beticola]
MRFATHPPVTSSTHCERRPVRYVTSPAQWWAQLLYDRAQLLTFDQLSKPEKVPQLVRSFEPSLDSFDEEHTATNLVVDDLVNLILTPEGQATAQLLDGISQILQQSARITHSESDLRLPGSVVESISFHGNLTLVDGLCGSDQPPRPTQCEQPALQHICWRAAQLRHQHTVV